MMATHILKKNIFKIRLLDCEVFYQAVQCLSDQSLQGCRQDLKLLQQKDALH